MTGMKQVDLFLGEKLHSVILALCTYTPSIMLAYAPKCEDVMTSIGFMDYSIRTDQLEIEKVLFLINSIENNISDYQMRLFSVSGDIRKQLLDNAKEMKSALGKSRHFV
jgi:polysaccharide pyruvyl transferase WcaK-like protein